VTKSNIQVSVVGVVVDPLGRNIPENNTPTLLSMSQAIPAPNLLAGVAVKTCLQVLSGINQVVLVYPD
jgi:hypothetical protein